MSSIASLMRAYVQMCDGRIDWVQNISLFPDKAGKRKRLRQAFARGQTRDWPDLEDSDGRTYSFFRSRGVRCPLPDQWAGQYPRFDGRRRPYFTILQSDCKACEFHEPKPQFGKRRYPRCRWLREWHQENTPSGMELLGKAVADADRILGS